MPILHSRLNLETQKPDGTVAPLAPSEALRQVGPVVQVTIGLAQSLSEELLQKGFSLPSPRSGMALIDTGASSTCIDEDAAQALGLPVVDVVLVASASHPATLMNIYPVQVEVTGLPISIERLRVIGTPLGSQGLIALIGRDILQSGIVFYNGISGEVTFAI